MFLFMFSFPEILELFLNILETIAILISVVTFFVLMINKYNTALRKILSPCGIGFWARIRVLFICRKSQNKKRAFIEYAIFKTGGCPVINSEWHNIINSFKAYYSEIDPVNPKYSIPNCTSLIENDFSMAIERYFKYFSQPKVRKTFGIQDDHIRLIIKIHIEEAYATPTCLLTGLLSQYNESWEEFIKRYVSTAYISENCTEQNQNIFSNELYNTFAWLLWGPSYEIEFRKYWAGLCQLSYGDESNSIPAIANIDTNIADRLKRKFLENEERRYGALLSADVYIYDKKPFLSSLRSRINPNNSYFYDKVESGDLSFAVTIEDFTPCLNYKSKKYYSTAYVWILFELEEDDFSFKPEKSLAFFEHANLADKETYTFLIETLIDKSLKHFEKIYENPDNSNRKYRLICAMNDKIAVEYINKVTKIMNSGTPFGDKLKSNILLESKQTPADVFASYDEFFSPRNLVNYVEISLNDQRSISDFGQFYTNIYMNAFPDDDEREGFDNFIKYLRMANNSKEYKYHIILAKDEFDRVIAGCVFNYFKKSNAGVIEFIAVKNDLQSGGIGTLLYKHVISILSKDAYKINRKKLEYVFCEIDSPEYSKSEIKKYLYFWNKNKFWHLNFNYIQPALSSGQKPVTGLWFTISTMNSLCKSVPSSLVSDVLYDYIKYAMSIEPNECNEFIDMKKELSSKGNVELTEIIKK